MVFFFNDSRLLVGDVAEFLTALVLFKKKKERRRKKKRQLRLYFREKRKNTTYILLSSTVTVHWRLWHSSTCRGLNSSKVLSNLKPITERFFIIPDCLTYSPFVFFGAKFSSRNFRGGEKQHISRHFRHKVLRIICCFLFQLSKY